MERGDIRREGVPRQDAFIEQSGRGGSPRRDPAWSFFALFVRLLEARAARSASSPVLALGGADCIAAVPTLVGSYSIASSIG